MIKYFVSQHSIVRQIWGNADTVLFIFAGASAEFALNKSVDWLYYTGKLPSDPLGRLFSTVEYSRRILFSAYDDALRTIDQITAIHSGVESSRGMCIPDEAYLDVLYLLIDYSIRSFELLEHKLIDAEKAEVFDVFYRVGNQMVLKNMPNNYDEWTAKRSEQLHNRLCNGQLTRDLYQQYKKHLGSIRFALLKQAQVLVVPDKVNSMLALGKVRWLSPVLLIYKFLRSVKLANFLKSAILPPAYINKIKAMDSKPTY